MGVSLTSPAEWAAMDEAAKRNRHMSKHQHNVHWKAVHDSVHGWKAKLVKAS